MSAAASTGSPADRRTSTSKSFSNDENVKNSIESPQAPAPKVKKIAILASSHPYPMDKLYAKLSEQQAILLQQKDMQKAECDARGSHGALDRQSTSSSLPITPATDAYPTTAPTTRSASIAPNDSTVGPEEVLRLKLELAQAQNKISRLDQELAQTRLVSHSGRVTPALGSEPDFAGPLASSVSPVASRFPVSNGMNVPVKQSFSREQSWMAPDDNRSDIVDPLSIGGGNRTRGIWNTNKSVFTNPFPQVSAPIADETRSVAWGGSSRSGSQAPYESSFSPAVDPYRSDRMPSEHDVMRPAGRRATRYDNRFGQPNNFSSGYAYGMAPTQYEGANAYVGGPPASMSSSMGMNLYPPASYQQQPIGTTLSPHATEFTSAGAPWKTETLTSEGQTYLPATEPLNYRRLLDRNVTCDWKYIVDKIVCNNDQQASIFLQQKLKVGTPEQKYDIVEAIVAQAYPLMINRFGNFLVQRCFEHGTPEQVIKIAEAIRGNTLNLSMDPFGCHVVQKAFDSVPEDYKAIMVHELLRRIPETVIHRYACHVWQKLFELRWTESPPQIMKYVNEALRGMWHEVALGETGSLVVQNIFENCLEEDKRPCIEEVLANIDIVAHGQFGNWCIQHICEHGAPADRSRAVDHVIRYAAEYSMDQFASKVVEKCLKISGPEFLSRYLDRVCEGRVDRPRIPLIDIASDQYGNYLIQYILTHAATQHREIVAAHIRKHMVSLRGSKFGSRVGMLCTNHAVATRPGPGVGPSIGGRMGSGPRYGGPYR
ncbi:armadillo-type protein [Cercophora newfieldiana]|uniref:Armadillo-type protein n=1 Tax=Cercophora newfieldiana TaxID=92897 RepID=A0AA39YEU3_9PEZI|nr:armadillo-type protein [Cercophora newfieldiana]